VETVLVFLLVIVVLALIVLILLQHGKGADIGAAFGSGASNTVFGSQGSGSFLMKLTLALAGVFFVLCLLLARIASQNSAASQNLNLPVNSSTTTVPVQTPAAPLPNNSVVPSVPSAPASK
jgi:preprotein translocase subunit SecG